MKGNIIKLILATGIVALQPASARGELTVPSFMTDSMVIQRNDVLSIAGKSDSPVRVASSWDGKTVRAVPDKEGRYLISVPTPEAGGPFEIEISNAGSRRILKEIYSGEVWLCSGQSNMEMPVGGWGKVMNYQEEIANAAEPDNEHARGFEPFRPAVADERAQSVKQFRQREVRARRSAFCRPP